MLNKLFLLLLTFSFFSYAQAQNSENSKSITGNFPDSVVVKVHPSYDKVTHVHEWFFGKNYRKEWGADVKLPLIKISEVYGGLTPEKEGGGMQSKSLRLKDKSGKEWVIRSVEKTPDKLLPENLRGTFALDWIDDAMSGQHPFSALIVPPLAQAADVHHTNPIIGVVAADAALGEYSKIFKGLVVLLEEREPGGKSDNTPEMISALNEDNDNRFNGEQFLRARLLDLLIGDWDRHEDQWRWFVQKKDKGKFYEAVPRDRDQVFHVNQGLFPSIAALPWVDPLLGDFGATIPTVKYSLFKTRFLKDYPDAQFSYAEWMKVVNDFVKAETDEVLEAGLKRMPREIYAIRHKELLSELKQRRDHIPAAMDNYYKFINRIVDIRTSDKNEKVDITNGPDQGMHVQIHKIDKSGNEKDLLLDMNYLPSITKEIRLYVSGGDDHVMINSSSPIKLKLIEGEGNKTVEVKQAGRKVNVYGRKDSATFTGNTGRLHLHLSNDTTNTRFVPANLYNVWMPLATAAINADDGFLLGLGFKYTGKDGFRNLPYSTVQQLMVTHSFNTDAFRIRYNGEWIQAIGKADITLQAFIQAPDNTMNFFSRGNETVLVKGDHYRRRYRARFDTYQFDPALRWHTDKWSTLSAGPSLQFYHFNQDDNNGRFITDPASRLNSYDSSSLNQDKAHAGLIVNYVSNHRNNNILPFSGYYLNINVQGYTGLNKYSKSFAQIRPEFTYYQRLNSTGTIVLSDRVGGGVSIGNPAFYQSMFLGGQGNLLGYLQNRFAGQHMVFNNLQARIKVMDVASYILPGQLGITGFYDAGRVWVKGEDSDQWHQGTGGGIYFAPASLTILQVLAGHSKEGWYPYISLNFRI